MCPMNNEDDRHSCSSNSTLKERGIHSTKASISEAIAEIFDVNQYLTNSNSFNIADLGCSIGPKTFTTVHNIVTSIELKCQSRDLDSKSVEFQVFFNDHVSNDFNKLFKSLPSNREYFATGTPGSFHGRLFPKSSLHFANTSYALQWLSKVPEEVVDEKSPAWNKGRIYYTSAPKKVVEAYSAQFARDMESFFNARAEEIVCGGLMAFIIPCLPDGTPTSESPLITVIDLLGASLLEMANLGLVSENKVDSFNFPMYSPTQQELEKLIDKNGCFKIIEMGPIVRATEIDETACEVRMFMLHLRAAWEGLIKGHFGSEIIDELFDRFTTKVVESSILSGSRKKLILELFVLLQHKAT